MGYLHIGQNVMVPEKQIIGIFDLDNTSQSKWTRKFLADAEKEGVVLSVTEDVPKSFLVCDHPYHRADCIYLSAESADAAKAQRRGAGVRAAACAAGKFV